MKINDRLASATREIISPAVKNRALPQLKLLQLLYIQISIPKYLVKAVTGTVKVQQNRP